MGEVGEEDKYDQNIGNSQRIIKIQFKNNKYVSQQIDNLKEYEGVKIHL